MAGSKEHSTDDTSGVSLLVIGLGGLLTVSTGVSITVLALVLVNTSIGGNLAVATLSLLGIVVGMGTYYVGMGELLGNGP